MSKQHVHHSRLSNVSETAVISCFFDKADQFTLRSAQIHQGQRRLCLHFVQAVHSARVLCLGRRYAVDSAGPDGNHAVGAHRACWTCAGKWQWRADLYQHQTSELSRIPVLAEDLEQAFAAVRTFLMRDYGSALRVSR